MGNGIGELWRNREPTKTRDRGSGFDWAAEEERRDSYSYIVLIAIWLFNLPRLKRGESYVSDWGNIGRKTNWVIYDTSEIVGLMFGEFWAIGQEVGGVVMCFNVGPVEFVLLPRMLCTLWE